MPVFCATLELRTFIRTNVPARTGPSRVWACHAEVFIHNQNLSSVTVTISSIKAISPSINMTISSIKAFSRKIDAFIYIITFHQNKKQNNTLFIYQTAISIHKTKQLEKQYNSSSSDPSMGADSCGDDPPLPLDPPKRYCGHPAQMEDTWNSIRNCALWLKQVQKLSVVGRLVIFISKNHPTVSKFDYYLQIFISFRKNI
jgi:hypothetical protein